MKKMIKISKIYFENFLVKHYPMIESSFPKNVTWRGLVN